MLVLGALVLVLTELSARCAASPNIGASGSTITLNADTGGDVAVKVGSAQPQSLLGIFSNVSTLRNDLQTVISEATLASARADNLSSTVDGLAGQITANNDIATNGLREMRVDIASAIDGVRDLNRKNVMCIADVITGVIPANTEPVFGQCNLTTGGSCIVACKSEYKASSSRNLAIGRPVSITGISYMSTNDAAYSTANVVNGMFDRANSSDRILAGCTNSLCAVAVDLGFLYTNITQFRAYTGYPSCSPGNRVCNEEGQYFNTMGDCSHYIQVWTGSNQTSLEDANAALGAVDAAGWTTVVAHPRPSRHGEEHPTMNPPVTGRFVRYLTDNRYATTSPGEGCARGNRWLRLYEFEVLTHATEEYTCGADGLYATSTRDLQCSLETSRNSGG